MFIYLHCLITLNLPVLLMLMDFFLPSFLELRLGDSLASRTSQAVVTWYSMVLWEWPAAETLCVPRAFSWMSSRPALHFLLHAVLNFSGFCKNIAFLCTFTIYGYCPSVSNFKTFFLPLSLSQFAPAGVTMRAYFM